MKIVLLLLFFVILLPVQVHASQVLFEHREQTYLSRNVTYERKRQVTSAGFLDIHILRVPLNDPYITIAPVESQRELGLRETTQALLSQAGAIGGVNADFFGLAGTHSLAFGPVIANGQLMSISSNLNQGPDEFAAFFLDENNIPMLRYVTPRIWFTVNGMELARVVSINKVASFNRPVIINRQGMMDTTQISARFPDLFKIVVDNGIVTSVTDQPVIVPENGFVVVMDGYHFSRYMPSFWIGMPAQYEVFTDLGRDLSQIQTAVGGGGLILQHGVTVNDTGTAVPGRHPRTALGFTADWQYLILMTVDGRGHSMGATHAEMANLLRLHGAFDAMHLDGGGSTTMVAQTSRDSNLEVVNRVSDGAQRRVINAIGVFDHSTPGEAYQLVLMPYDRYVAYGSTLYLHAYALDLYRHRVALNPGLLEFFVYTIDNDGQMHPVGGNFSSNTPLLLNQLGSLYIRAQYGEITASKTYIVQDVTIDYYDENRPFQDPLLRDLAAGDQENALNFNASLPGQGSLAYSIRQEGPAAVLQMTAAEGGIFATDRSQWGRFSSDIELMSPYFVIIRMDANPLQTLSRDERELFHQALRTQQQMGRTVFVISNVEESPTLTIRDGIRYIDLGNTGEDSTVQFRVIGQQIWYDF